MGVVDLLATWVGWGGVIDLLWTGGWVKIGDAYAGGGACDVGEIDRIDRIDR